MKKIALGALIALVIGIMGLFIVSGNIFSLGNNVEINERQIISSKNMKEMNISVDVGDIHISQINSSELTVHSDVGDITVDQFKGIGTFGSSVGDIELEKISGKIKAQTDTGEIDLSLDEITNDINLSSDVGDITVRLGKEPENIAFDLSSDLGDISIDGFKGLENRTTGSIITQIGSGGPLLQAKTDVGEITVEK